jgi:cbb3-type cytochrome oxidase subunit 1
MERFVVLFLRASLLWLVAGVSLGVAMAVHPAWLIYRPAHLHMMLLGFVTLMISGVAYNVFPRFVAAPLHSRRLAWAHLVVANAGLPLMVAGFVCRFRHPTAGLWLLGSGGTLSAFGLLSFGWNLWRTLDHAPQLPSAMPAARPLRVMTPTG